MYTDAEIKIDLQELINLLKIRRIELGLSQTKLAKMIGLHQSSISEFESHATAPSMISLLKICKALKLKLEFIYNPAFYEDN